MAGLISVSINVEDLPKEKFVVGKKGTYYNFTISVNDDTNQFGQNVSLFDSQTKEEREAKKSKRGKLGRPVGKFAAVENWVTERWVTSWWSEGQSRALQVGRGQRMTLFTVCGLKM